MNDVAESGTNRCRLRVTGRVQGVWFRAWTAARARELGVRGWVRNCGDGSVELEAEGLADALGKLREAVAVGPSQADVTGVHDLRTSTEALADPFEIRPSDPGAVP